MPEPKKTAARAPAKPRRPPAASTKRSTATSTAAKRKAREATRAAKAAGATGKRLAAAQQVLRDSMIVARVHAGDDRAEVAKDAGVTRRTLDRVLELARKQRSPLDVAPMDLLEDLARGFQRDAADLSAAAWAWFEVNQTASLGAMKAASEARVRLAQLLENVGKLPSNLEVFRTEMEMQRIAEEMGRMLLAVKAGQATPDDAIAFFSQLVANRERAQLDAGEVTPA